MSAYHIACYNKSFGRTAKAAICRKFESKCAVCGNMIRFGDEFTWTRRGQNAAATEYPETPNETPAEPMKNNSDSIADILVNAIMPAVEARLADVDVTKLADQVKELLGGAVARTIAITINDSPPVDVGIQHKQFPTLMRALAARVDTWIAGPSGSGKTTAAIAAAKALDLPFYYSGAVNDAISLMGYKTATGEYVSTLLRQAYEHGGVFLLDECDACDPGAMLALNALLANGHAAFPDGMVTRHKDCIILAAANTWGHGATREYVGRNKQDTAFIKRFAFLEWAYDYELELATAPNMGWAKRVQEIRKRVESKGLRVLVTPRETYIGARLLAAGIPQDEVEAMTLRSGMTEEQWKQVAA